MKAFLCNVAAALLFASALGCNIKAKIDETPPPVSTACDPALTGSFGGGSGTALSPFAICSLAQWSYFASDSTSWNKVIQLESDLDFTGISVADFKMVGNATTAFTGSFKGNSKAIKNISLTGGTTDLGLFLNTDGSVVFSDLTIQDVSISTTGRVGTLVVTHGSTGSLTLNSITANNISLPAFGNYSGGNPNLTGVYAVSTAGLQSSTPFTNWLATVWTFTNAVDPKLAWEP